MGKYINDNNSGRSYNVTIPSQNFELCNQLNKENRIIKEIVKMIDIDDVEDREILEFIKVMR